MQICTSVCRVALRVLCSIMFGRESTSNHYSQPQRTEWRRPEKSSSPSSSHEQHYANNYYDPDIGRHDLAYDDDLQIHCPPSTTRRKLITKIDLRVIPVLSILYLLAFLDRTNIANASVFGLQDELLEPRHMDHFTH